MVTVVNNPAPSNNSGGPVGIIITLVVVAILGYLVYVYGLPAIRQSGTPQINVPDKIDVKVNQSE